MYKVIIISLLVLITACNKQPNSRSGQADSTHQHADEGLQYTLFSEQFEFFIEHPPLEAGKEAEFLVHLTDLLTYKPCSTGHVTILIDGISVTSGEPSTPGIFRIPFVPNKEGAFHAEFIYKKDGIPHAVEEHVHVYKDHDDINAAEADDGGHSHASE